MFVAYILIIIYKQSYRHHITALKSLYILKYFPISSIAKSSRMCTCAAYKETLIHHDTSYITMTSQTAKKQSSELLSLCERALSVSDGFPSQSVSDAETVFMLWFLRVFFSQYSRMLIYRQTFNISRTILGHKLVVRSGVVRALVQLHVHSRLNTWLQWIR